VASPSAEQGIDQDVQVLADIVTGFNDVAAMAVDPRGKVRFDRLPPLDHQGAVLEVAHPQGPRLVPTPTATDLLLGSSQLPPRSAFAPQVLVEGAPRNAAAELPLQDPIDDLVRALGLLLLQLDGTSQQVGVLLPGLSPIGSPPTVQPRHASIL